jgi:hypothetical protein
MWPDGPRRDVPSAELREDRRGTRGRERHRPPRRLTCPHGGHSAWRLCRAHGPVPADRGQACEGDDTRLTGTGCAKTRPRPATRVLRRRGRRATTAGPTTGLLGACGVLPTHGRALGAATLPRDGDPREARMGAGGAWGWACVRAMATPARAPGPHGARTGVPAGVSTGETDLSREPPLTPGARRHGAHPRGCAVWAEGLRPCSLATREPN